MENSNRPIKKFDIHLIEFDDDEVIICEIRKHTFGLFLIYLTGLLIAVVGFTVSIYLSLWLKSSAFISTVSGQSLAVIGLVVATLVIVLTLVYAFIFSNNTLLVTSEKIAQILYKSLFDRKVSQLNINDVQDVTFSQVGIFARAFNYGTLVIETAGEQQNYTFTFAPNPHECAKDIIAAHEANVKQFGN